MQSDLNSAYQTNIGQQQFESQITDEDFERTISFCKKATEVMKTNNDAWHYFSQINYEASKFYSLKFAE